MSLQLLASLHQLLISLLTMCKQQCFPQLICVLYMGLIKFTGLTSNNTYLAVHSVISGTVCQYAVHDSA